MDGPLISGFFGVLAALVKEGYIFLAVFSAFAVIVFYAFRVQGKKIAKLQNAICPGCRRSKITKLQMELYERGAYVNYVNLILRSFVEAYKAKTGVGDINDYEIRRYETILEHIFYGNALRTYVRDAVKSIPRIWTEGEAEAAYLKHAWALIALVSSIFDTLYFPVAGPTREELRAHQEKILPAIVDNIKTYFREARQILTKMSDDSYFEQFQRETK